MFSKYGHSLLQKKWCGNKTSTELVVSNVTSLFNVKSKVMQKWEIEIKNRTFLRPLKPYYIIFSLVKHPCGVLCFLKHEENAFQC